MDLFSIVIIVVVLALLVIVAVLLMSNKSEDTPSSTAESAGDHKAENPTLIRFKQVLSDNDLQSEMRKEEQELLTKYTAGTGEGIAEVEKLLVSDPNNVDLLDWLAFMYYSNNEIEKAINTYKRALAIKPNNENQHYYLANSYFKKQMYADAKREWEEVVKLKPNSKIARNAQERIEYIKANKLA